MALPGTKETTKWILANQKVDRVSKIIRSKLIEAGHDVDSEMKVIDGVPVMIRVKADKDVYQAPNGRMRIVFGAERGRTQVVPVRDDAQNIDGLVAAIGLYVRAEQKAMGERERVTLEFRQGRERAKKFCDFMGLTFDENQLTNRVIIQGNFYADFSGEKEMCLFVKNVATEELAYIVKRYLEEHEGH